MSSCMAVRPTAPPRPSTAPLPSSSPDPPDSSKSTSTAIFGYTADGEEGVGDGGLLVGPGGGEGECEGRSMSIGARGPSKGGAAATGVVEGEVAGWSLDLE